MTESSKLVEKAIRRLIATCNSVKQRMAWSLSRSRGCLHNIHYARVTARDSIGHAERGLLEMFFVAQLVEHLSFMQSSRFET